MFPERALERQHPDDEAVEAVAVVLPAATDPGPLLGRRPPGRTRGGRGPAFRATALHATASSR